MVQKGFAIKALIIIVLAILASIFLVPYLQDYFIFESIDIVSIWLIGFILGIMLKVNYSGALFIFNLIIGTLIVSYYSFGQGLILVLLLIVLEKLFKLI